MLSTAAAALAAITDAPAIAEPSEDPQLLALGAEFDRALSTFEVLSRRARDLLNRYEATVRLRSPAVVTAADIDLFSRHFQPGSLDGTLMSQLEVGAHYTDLEVDALKRSNFQVCTKFYAGAAGIPLDWEPDALAQNRAAEIIAAWERCLAEDWAVFTEFGCEKADQAEEEAQLAVDAIVERMVTIPARTIEGIRMKARALSFLHFDYTRPRPTFRGDAAVDDNMTTSIVYDLLAACPREQIPYNWIPDTSVG